MQNRIGAVRSIGAGTFVRYPFLDYGIYKLSRVIIARIDWKTELAEIHLLAVEIILRSAVEIGNDYMNKFLGVKRSIS